jgi:TonB family protein
LERAQLAWPRFKSNPKLFLETGLSELLQALRRTFARPYLRHGLLVAIAIVVCVILSVTLWERRHAGNTDDGDAIDLTSTRMIDLRETQPSNDSQPGVGGSQNANGRVGFANGRGEGSGPTPARAQGGGSGGNHSELAASIGRPPVPSEIPAPITRVYDRLPSLPVAGLDIDPVLFKQLPYPDYGDLRSKSTATSNGPGQGGGIGTKKGLGDGDGDGNGFGAGRDANMGTGDNTRGCCGPGGSKNGNSGNDIERIFRQPEVTVRARVISKPEPQYTEEARKAGITGTVILSVVFDRTGQVTNIRTVQTLCCGLTEKAIAAARQIRFIPAMRGNQVVSTYMQLQYNFNLY